MQQLSQIADDIRKSIARLNESALEIISLVQSKKSIAEQAMAIQAKYEKWYLEGGTLIRQLAPERLAEYQICYRNEKRKAITLSTYTVEDFFSWIEPYHLDPASTFLNRLYKQLAIIESIDVVLDSRLRDIVLTIRTAALDSDLAAASSLLRNGHCRAGGVIAGVVLESHLRMVADARGIRVPAKATLATLNDTLKNENVYEVAVWRFIQHLADLRNVCAHKGDAEPTVDSVNDLLQGVSKISKQVM